MVALDIIEQLHAAALHPEHTDAIGDLGPFGIQVAADEAVGQCADAKPSGFGMGPVENPSRATATALVSSISLPEKKRRCCSACSRSSGLSNNRPLTLTTLSLPMTQSPGFERLTATALAAASSRAIDCRFIDRPLDRGFVDIGGEGLMFDTRGHRASRAGSDWKRRGSGPLHNLVDKCSPGPSAKVGTASTARSSHFASSLFELSSPGMESAPSL